MRELAELTCVRVVLWALVDPDALSSRARALLADSGNHLLVSSASAWEIATKHRLGRLPAAELLLASFPEHIRQLGAEELTIAVRHALTAGAFSSPHRDPVDRMLAAQALLEGVPLVTNDAAFSQFPVETLW